MVCLDSNPVWFPSTDAAAKVSMDGDGSLLRTAWEEGGHRYQDMPDDG